MATTWASSGAMEDPLADARRAVAESRFRDAVDLLATVPASRKDSAEWHLLKAMASWRLGDFAASRIAALAARGLFRDVGDADGDMRSENVAAAGAFALGDLEEAEERFARALRLAEGFGDKMMTARCANNLGNVAYYRGRRETALSFYSTAATTFEQILSRRGLAEAWHNIGLVWRDLGDLDEAQRAHERAVDAAEQLGDARMLGQALAGKGETEMLLGDIRLGQARLRQALRLARETENVLGETEALRVLSLIERREGNDSEAEQLALSALAIARNVHHRWLTAAVARDLGNFYADAGRQAEGVTCLTEAATAYDRLGAVERADRLRKQIASLQS